MSRKFLIAFILLAIGFGVQGCTVKPKGEEACGFVQNSDQQRVAWGSDTPVTLFIDMSVPTEFYDAINAAADAWNTASRHQVIRIGGWTNTVGTPGQDGKNIIYFLKDWESDKSLEQARTTVYWAGDRIYEADIRINGKNFDFFSSNTPIANRVDVQSLILHEMGHVLGLAHNTASESVMLKSLASATLRRSLGSVDVNSIRCEY